MTIGEKIKTLRKAKNLKQGSYRVRKERTLRENIVPCGKGTWNSSF